LYNAAGPGALACQSTVSLLLLAIGAMSESVNGQLQNTLDISILQNLDSGFDVLSPNLVS
jgi:hypothetical protein